MLLLWQDKERGEDVKKRVRLSLDITKEQKKMMDELQVKTLSGSLAEVIRRAMALFHLVIDVQSEGGKVIIQDADGNQEIIRLL